VRANQAAAFDPQGQWRPARLSTVIAPVLGARVLFDGQWRPFDIDLLDDTRIRWVRPQPTAAAGTGIELMSDKCRDLLGRKGLACMLVVAGLAANGTLLAIVSLGRLRLDDVRRGRFRRRSGILLSSRQLLAHTRQFRFERRHLGRKDLALGTDFGC
jgi:hypothetical protein